MICPCYFFFGQDTNLFNTIYNKTYLETSQKDFLKAVSIADSLYTHSDEPLLKVKSLMLSATLYAQKGEFEKSLSFGVRSQNIIESTNNIIWKARVYGFLATHYRFVGLFEQNKVYTEMGLEVSKMISDEEQRNYMMVMFLQEKAYMEIENKNYKKSIKQLSQTLAFLGKIRQNKDVLEATNEQLFGYNYYHINNIEKAYSHYEKALQISHRLPENFITALINNGLALIYISKKDLVKAGEYLKTAKRIADNSHFLSLKDEVYNTSEKYYTAEKDLDKYLEVKYKHDTVKTTLQNNARLSVEKSYERVNENINTSKFESYLKNFIISTILLIMCVGIYFFIKYRNRQKKNIERYKLILKYVNQKLYFSNSELIKNKSEGEIHEIKKENSDQEPLYIPSQTIEKILSKLDDFEQGEMFTDRNISLSYLSNYCETNSKYLSYILKNYKETDFSNYINSLKINFIIRKLRNDPKYRKYKISVLAEEVGFSSPNKFSLIFKKYTELSPSQFINLLNEDFE